jgi:hypothetical protein
VLHPVPWPQRRKFITLASGAALSTIWPLVARTQLGERRQITVWIGHANDAEGQRLGTAFRAALNGFVASLVTGFISNEPTLGSKWMGLLEELNQLPPADGRRNLAIRLSLFSL